LALEKLIERYDQTNDAENKKHALDCVPLGAGAGAHSGHISGNTEPARTHVIALP